jgi:hypothetical protein
MVLLSENDRPTQGKGGDHRKVLVGFLFAAAYRPG